MTDRETERLVEEIARRVKEELIGGAGGGGSGGGGASCGSQSGTCGAQCSATREECTGTGLCAARRAGDVMTMVGLGAGRIGAGCGVGRVVDDLAALIDHTLLKPDATRDELKALCEEARRYGFATVCVSPANVRYVSALISGSKVLPISVVGFPTGASTKDAKAFEAREAIRNGAREIDMVINVGALKSGDYRTVLEDIQAVVKAAGRVPVKVIIEAALLTDEEKVAACTLAKVAGAAFVKTSTGFGPGGATFADVELMRRVVGREMGVKASGGIRTTEDARRMVKAGADRIGASASVAIVTGKRRGP